MLRAFGVTCRVAFRVLQRQTALEHLENVRGNVGQLVAVAELDLRALELRDLASLLRAKAIDRLAEQLARVASALDARDHRVAEPLAHGNQNVPLDVAEGHAQQQVDTRPARQRRHPVGNGVGRGEPRLARAHGTLRDVPAVVRVPDVIELLSREPHRPVP